MRDSKDTFFGNYAFNQNEFPFSQQEIKSIPDVLTDPNAIKLNNSAVVGKKSKEWKPTQSWYFDGTNEEESSNRINIDNEIVAPFASMNFLSELAKSGKNNAHRPKHGYRYSKDLKLFATYNRILSGRMAYNTLQANAFGLIPSINSIDKFTYKPDNVIIEGELRFNELLIYLQQRKQPL